MARDSWLVKYNGSQLWSAAVDKKKYHESRKQWWMDKKGEVMEEIKSHGLTVTESTVDELMKTGYTNRGDMSGPTVQIDAGLQAKLREAHSKVHSHQSFITQYDAWMQMLSEHEMAVFEVDHDDWMFFFGK